MNFAKWVTLLASLFVGSCHSNSIIRSGSGYVIFDFYHIDEEVRKDYWLAVSNGWKTWHLSSSIPVHALRADTYTITHLDRSTNLNRSPDDLEIPVKQRIDFDVGDGEVVYLGIFTLKSIPSKKGYEIGVSTGLGLMQRACMHAPNIFDKGKVTLGILEPEEGSHVKFQCIFS
ncbi:hypothetical protein KUV22_06790 [Microbulbifer agarilyticus]|uniref:hypothetical protein n=1 Tax=Microbulbifer agarilyticus TaxID=260552 RepID=UPI001C95D0FD|nr:hypothetical protein [Microbulbifer agarilyticus]MBY6190125.1 hypothetical protein [Microbulbifer agarilyticus]